jgi:hypothetical protein
MGQPTHRLGRSVQHGPAARRMNGEQIRLQPRQRANGSASGIRNVVQLEIEKNRVAAPLELADNTVAARQIELQPHLEPGDGAGELVGTGQRRSSVGKIEGNDQPVFNRRCGCLRGSRWRGRGRRRASYHTAILPAQALFKNGNCGECLGGKGAYMPGLVSMATSVREGFTSTRSSRTRAVPRWLKPRRLAAA